MLHNITPNFSQDAQLSTLKAENFAQSGDFGKDYLTVAQMLEEQFQRIMLVKTSQETLRNKIFSPLFSTNKEKNNKNKPSKTKK